MSEARQYLRFPISYRVEHWVLAVVFVVLAVTGLPQKYAAAAISIWIVSVLGGIETVRVIHHTAAIILVAEAIYHIGAVQYRVYVRGDRMDLLPGWRDVVTAFCAFMYNIGLCKKVPAEGRYTFAEKAEYWAVVWGTVLMAITGFMMWNPITTAHFLPGDFIPAAKMAHGYEAVLAVLAIIIWHFYYVLVKNLNKSMFTGYLSEEQMEYEHALELADIKAGITLPQIDPKKVQRWNRVILPRFAVVTCIAMLGVFALTRLEKTTIGVEVPPESVTIYSPLIPEEQLKAELPGPLATGARPTWGNGIGALLHAKCGSCHGSPLLMGNLNLESYQGAIAGGTDKVIAPRDPDNSLIVRKIEGGGHPGRLTKLQMDALRSWILNGAQEGEYVAGLENWVQPGTEAPTLSTVQPELTQPGAEGETPAGQNYTWENRVGAIFRARCGGCHGDTVQSGGLNLTSYVGALKVISPGHPDSSRIITKVQGGGHPGHLSAQELEIVRAWIQNGAPGIRRAEPPAPAPQPSPPSPAPAENPATEAPAPPLSTYTWEDTIGAIFQRSCISCHGQSNQTAGLNLSTYQGTIAGGTDKVIVPGDPDHSLLITKMEAGGHPGQLSDDDLTMVRRWIAIGAPEKQSDIAATEPTEPPSTAQGEPAITPPAPPEPETPAGQASAGTWDGGIGAIFALRCGACHGESTHMGSLNLSTYLGAMTGGTDKVILPGDPDGSLLIQKMLASDHPGHLADDELSMIREWIRNGALER